MDNIIIAKNISHTAVSSFRTIL